MNPHGQRGSWQLTAFGIRVKKKLTEKNMKIRDLAEIVGMSLSFLSQVLYGRKEGLQYIEAIKDTLGIKDGKKNAEKVG